MKFSIDRFYEKHSGYLDAVSGYLEDDLIAFIIKGCRLKPLSSITGILSYAPKLEQLWVDEHQTSIQIFKDKRVKVTYNDLSIEREKLISTDIFLNVEMVDLPRISKFAYLAVLDDESVLEPIPVYLISFIGRDNYFRTRVFIHDKWINISSLYLGLKLLRLLVDHFNNDNFVELDIKNVIPAIPMEVQRQWVTPWPPSKYMVKVLNAEVPSLLQQFNGK